MFDLDKAIEEWRKQMVKAGIKTPVPLDELESHLREEMEQQVRLGSSAQQAFEAAAQRIGQASALKSEFRKVEKAKPVLQRKAPWILIGVAFLSCWIAFGPSPAVALVYGLLLAGLIVATFVDFQHFVIPDRLTIGGVFAGFLCSLLLPQLHGQKLFTGGMLQSLLGIGAGAGLLYFILRAGKLAFGRQRLTLASDAKIVLTDTALRLPEKAIPYHELFYRNSDAITLQARTVELAGQSYQDVPIRLTRTCLKIGNDKFNPAEVTHMEAASSEIVLPREAMGLGDVKFMAAIGAFLGWQAVIFSLLASSLIGSLVGFGLIAAHRREWSARVPYGPYLALAATIWIFGGKQILEALFAQ
jgi:leader peptidase (prepilin peptidase)/N-methyltransferase